MQKFTALFLMIVILLSLCGCIEEKDNNTSTNIQEVTIKLPEDDTVNGYRTESVSESSTVPANAPIIVDAKTAKFCANTSSKKFHKSNCSHIKNTLPENKHYTNSKEDLIDLGYSPCKVCNP